MSKSLQEGLLKMGLVDSSTYKERPESHIEQKLKYYPTNRFGKPVTWAKWLVRRRTPGNSHRRCCLCGLTVRDKYLKKNKAIADEVQQEFADANLEIGEVRACNKCLGLV